MSKFFHSKLFLISALAIVIMSITGLWREVSGTLKTKKQIDQLQKQAANLQQRNDDLKQLIQYLGSSDYQDKAAREQLNLQAPGEVAVALPDNSTSTESTTPATQANIKLSNPKIWWNYFFGLRTRTE